MKIIRFTKQAEQGWQEITRDSAQGTTFWGVKIKSEESNKNQNLTLMLLHSLNIQKPIERKSAEINENAKSPKVNGVESMNYV